MATPQLVSVRDFNTSRFSQLADTSTANVSDILARAESAIMSRLQRPIAPTVFTETFRPQEDTIYLRNRPILSVDNINRRYTILSAPLPVTAYVLNAKAGYIESPWFYGMLVDVTYTAGFESVPEDLKEAILLQAALFAFQDLEIYGSGDGKEPGILYIKRDITELLKPYQQTHTAFTR